MNTQFPKKIDTSTAAEDMNANWELALIEATDLREHGCLASAIMVFEMLSCAPNASPDACAGAKLKRARLLIEWGKALQMRGDTRAAITKMQAAGDLVLEMLAE